MSGAGTDFAVVRGGRASSGPIGEGMFGANYLQGRDALNGTFGATARELGVTSLRWPGGGIAEDWFDPARPSAPAGPGGETLRDFLAFCAAHGIAPVIVLPTKRYAGDIARGEREIADFVARVTAGEFGGPPVAAFEIGNEFYAASQLHPAIGAGVYGEIASRLAVAVEGAAAYDVDISVQMGRTEAANDLIMAAFDRPAERAAVTMLSEHHYPWQHDEIAARTEERSELARAWAKIGVDADVYMSEWNLGSNGDATEDSRHDYGMRQLPALLELFSRSVEAGVDRAAIWGVQQGTKTALGALEGQGGIWAAGHLFRLMAESLPGTRVLPVGDDVRDAEGPRVYAFEDADSLVLFVAAGDLDDAAGPLRFRLVLDGFGSRFSQGWSEELSAIGDPDAPRTPVRIALGSHAVTLDAQGRQGVTLTFDGDHDVIRLVLAKTNPALPAAPSGTGATPPGGAGDDVLAGGAGAETIQGQGGHDRLAGAGGADMLSGGAGFDTLAGGAGDDRLSGGDGTDRIAGNTGADILRGGAASDILSGGAGADRLFGEEGADFLDGGADDDLLAGGAGADYFLFADGHGTDRVLDFADGLDTIDLSDVAGVNGWQDLSLNHLGQEGADAVIRYPGGTIVFAGVDAGTLGAADFIFA